MPKTPRRLKRSSANPVVKKRRTNAYKRKRSMRTSTVTIAKFNPPIADRYMCKLNYTELIELSYSGTLNVYQFNINNLNDPNRSSTGHQPMFYDQLGALYLKTRVHGMKYSITFSNTNPAYQGEAIVQIRPNTTTSATFEDAMEDNTKQYRILGAEGSGPTTISGYVSTAKAFNVTKGQINTDFEYVAGIGGNPANQACLNIYVQNQAVATALVIIARVNLTYFAEFFERKIQGAS